MEILITMMSHKLKTFFGRLISKKDFPQGMEKNPVKKKMRKRDRLLRFIRRRKAYLKKNSRKVLFSILGIIIISGVAYLIIRYNSSGSPFGIRKRLLVSTHKSRLGRKIWKILNPKQINIEQLIGDASSEQKPAAPRPNHPDIESEQGYYGELFKKGIVLAPGLISVSHGLTHMARYYSEGDKISASLMFTAALQEGLYCLMLGSDCKPRPPRRLLLYPLFNKILVVKYRSFRKGDIVTLKELYGW